MKKMLLRITQISSLIGRAVVYKTAPVWEQHGVQALAHLQLDVTQLEEVVVGVACLEKPWAHKQESRSPVPQFTTV
jgi:hypothetical protein